MSSPLNSACNCCQAPPSFNMGILRSFSGENCSNTCGDTGNPDDPCGYYLTKITEGRGNNLTGRTETCVYPIESTECGKSCPPAECTCTGGYTIKTARTSNFTYPCGSAIEEITETEIVEWDGTCDFGRLTSRTFEITQCSGSFTVSFPGDEEQEAYTITGEAKVWEGFCIFEISEDGEVVGFAFPQNIGFGIYSYGELCDGQVQTDSTTITRTPPVVGGPEEPEFGDQNSGCEGWCGDPAEEIEDLQDPSQWSFLMEEIQLSAGSSANGNIKFRESVNIKFAHTPTPSCYLKVWFETKTTIFGPSTESDCGPAFNQKISETTEVTTYEWEGSATTGNLCVDPPITEENLTPDQVIYGGQETIEAETSNGQSKIMIYKILKWSLIKGYEPNDPDEDGDQGCNPNAYPSTCTDD